MDGEPTNWSELRSMVEAQLDEDREELEDEARRAARVDNPSIPRLTGAFDGSPEYLARLFLVGGAERARGACFLAEALPRLLVYGDEPPQVAPSSSVGVLSYVGLLRCLGVPLPAKAEGLESRWLPIIASRPPLLTAFHARAAALAAVAAGLVDLVPAIQQAQPLVPRRETRRVSGVDVAAFTRHAAEVIAGGGGAEAVEGPWRAFLKAFPLTLTAERGKWIDLVWAAIAMMTQFEKRPVADVGTWLPALVKELE